MILRDQITELYYGMTSWTYIDPGDARDVPGDPWDPGDPLGTPLGLDAPGTPGHALWTL